MKIIRMQSDARRLQGVFGRRAFSLIEVTISIAITAVALVSLMGMLPAGMRIMREAGDRAVETRIHQQILGELQLTDWDKRADYDSKLSGIWFYDDQGIRIYKIGNRADRNFAFNHVYSARVTLPTRGESLPQSMGGASYQGMIIPPDNSMPASDDPYLQLVIVEVTSVIDEALEQHGGFDKQQYQNTIRSFHSTITRMNK